jgi:cell division transport system permease protein
VKAFMVYLGAMGVAGFLMVQQVTSGWERSIRGSITVQFSSASSGAGAGGEVSSALDILRATPGVASAKPVSDDETFALLSAWLDGGPLAQDLPVLRLVDVQPEPGASIDVHPLQERLEHWPH